ncbi:MAG: hypothetical protein O3B73_14805 [bacterium]|nr:hypothetical protein [bacterium]
MLFGSLFNSDKGISIGKRKKRKMTTRDVIDRLNGFEFTAANCTLLRDHLGNEKIENYGQVDVFRLRDEEVFTIENSFCITTPTGMKLKSDVGANLASIVSDVGMDPDNSKEDPFEDFSEEPDEEDAEATKGSDDSQGAPKQNQTQEDSGTE